MRRRGSTNWPETLGFQVGATLREPVTYELRFHPKRKWRLDVALERLRIAAEIDGGGFLPNGGGRHSRGLGMERDAEKFAEAAILGWTVIRCTPRQVQNGQALQWIERLVTARGR